MQKLFVLICCFSHLLAIGEAIAQTLKSIDYDKKIGAQMEKDILSDPYNYPILDKNHYPDAYQLIGEIQDQILASGEVKYKEEFAWQYYIINDSKTLNAFATPGGYIYIYTGLMKYLDNEAQLAAVVGHEIAHADKRHSVQQMGKERLSSLLQRRRSRKGKATSQVLSELRNLKYSRTDESESDTYAIKYLCGSSYDPQEFPGFFQKMAEESKSREIPEFKSTHPSDEKRVENMLNQVNELGCTGNITNSEAYRKLVDALPSSSPKKRQPLRKRRRWN